VKYLIAYHVAVARVSLIDIFHALIIKLTIKYIVVLRF